MRFHAESLLQSLYGEKPHRLPSHRKGVYELRPDCNELPGDWRTGFLCESHSTGLNAGLLGV